jgi:hypothetical protein
MVSERISGEEDAPRGKSKFDKATKDRIIAAMRAGAHVQVAVQAAGVGRSTYYLWMNNGRLAAVKVDEGMEITKEERGFLNFFLDIVQAEAEAEVRLLTHWSKAAANDWRAAKDLLARRHPERWKEVSASEVSVEAGLLNAVDSVEDDGIMALARALQVRELNRGEPVDAEIVEDEDEMT